MITNYFSPPGCSKQHRAPVTCPFLTEFEKENQFFVKHLFKNNAPVISNLMVLLDVPFKVTPERKALSTRITGMIASCHIHPPLTKAH